MKNKVFWLKLLYYPLLLVIYTSYILIVGVIVLPLSKIDFLNDVLLVMGAAVSISATILFFILVRSSLLKWYVDPFAALTLPVWLYLMRLFWKMTRGTDILSAFHLTNAELYNDTEFGWVFLFCLFILGLVASISFKRVKEQSISYRILNRAVKRTK